jgi:hypothetical protein
MLVMPVRGADDVAHQPPHHRGFQPNPKCLWHAHEWMGGLWVTGASTRVDDGVGVNVVGEQRMLWAACDVFLLLEGRKGRR